ncbi:recombinase RecT [Acetobacter indonesiensis]|uniref:recombinase RecT n=1 Tax=Acetobacter indonesiensis TaxID=104101 RepID=UPI0039EB4216
MSGALTTAGNHTPAIQITSFDQLMRFASIAAKSGMVPQAYSGKPEAVLIAVQMGSELGLAPLQSLQNIAVINGRPSVWGDALLGLVRAAPVCDDVIERIEGDGEKMVAICIAKRKGKEPVESRFSVSDAVAANLWNKQGPWKQYPKRMLQMRARGFALRDAFPDVLRGLISAEEAQDLPQETIDVTPHSQRIEQPRQIDHRALMAERLTKCSDVLTVDTQWRNWDAAIANAEKAGKIIPEDVQSDVRDMIAARRAELEQKAAEAPVDEVVA